MEIAGLVLGWSESRSCLVWKCSLKGHGFGLADFDRECPEWGREDGVESPAQALKTDPAPFPANRSSPPHNAQQPLPSRGATEL